MNEFTNFVLRDVIESTSKTREETLHFLEENAAFDEKIDLYLWHAYYLPDLVNSIGWWKGLFFVMNEVWYEIQHAYLLLLEGFYRPAIFCIRSGLEQALLYTFFAEKNSDPLKDNPMFLKWLSSQEKTEPPRKVREELAQLR